MVLTKGKKKGRGKKKKELNLLKIYVSGIGIHKGNELQKGAGRLILKLDEGRNCLVGWKVKNITKLEGNSLRKMVSTKDLTG